MAKKKKSGIAKKNRFRKKNKKIININPNLFPKKHDTSIEDSPTEPALTFYENLNKPILASWKTFIDGVEKEVTGKITNYYITTEPSYTWPHRLLEALLYDNNTGKKCKKEEVIAKILPIKISSILVKYKNTKTEKIDTSSIAFVSKEIFERKIKNHQNGIIDFKAEQEKALSEFLNNHDRDKATWLITKTCNKALLEEHPYLTRITIPEPEPALGILTL